MNADFGKRVMEDMREVIAVATGLTAPPASAKLRADKPGILL